MFPVKTFKPPTLSNRSSYCQKCHRLLIEVHFFSILFCLLSDITTEWQRDQETRTWHEPDSKWELVGLGNTPTLTHKHTASPTERHSYALEGASHAQLPLRSKLSVAQSVWSQPSGREPSIVPPSSWMVITRKRGRDMRDRERERGALSPHYCCFCFLSWCTFQIGNWFTVCGKTQLRVL